jgi:hypothetical protein
MLHEATPSDVRDLHDRRRPAPSHRTLERGRRAIPSKFSPRLRARSNPPSIALKDRIFGARRHAADHTIEIDRCPPKVKISFLCALKVPIATKDA